MSDVIETDICVIGAGSGGLSVAAGASQMGARVVLIEKGLMGGDCLNYGCVPSKALIAAGEAARAIRDAGRFGIQAQEPQVDMAAVRDHIRGVIDGIAPNDSVERFEGLGCTVIKAAARFTARDMVQAGCNNIRAKYFVVATGSSPMVPPIPGLEDVPFHTNETIFEVDHAIDHLIVVGGGPIGLEMAQAHRRLGAKVTVLEMFTILGKDDPEAADVVRQRLQAEGIDILEHAKVTGVSGADGAVSVQVETGGGLRDITGSHLLIAGGRKPNLDDLDLEKAGIDYSPKGIAVDARLRTSNRKIFAIGDVRGGLQFTHTAGYDAGIVIRNALFKLPAKANYNAAPWVTYTDPELAHVGKAEKEAIDELGAQGINVLRWSFGENDRARAEREMDGFAKVITDRKGRVLGATIVGRHAGELLAPWIMAVGKRQKIGDIAGMIIPYPTLVEVGKRAAGSYYVPSLFSERTRKIVRFLLRF